MDKQTRFTRTVFVINPKSGNGAALRELPRIKELMQELKLSYEIMMTEYPMHAQEIARSYRQSDGVRIIGVGGDGTINEILNGINVGVPLGIIPCGSGNDFFRMIANTKVDMKQLIQDTVQGEICLIDYGIMNGRKFLNSCSIGFDAKIAADAKALQTKNKLPLRGGAYMVAALKGIVKPTIMHATLELNTGTIRKDMMLMSVMNGRWYGGGFCPAPQADVMDGMFDISVIDFLSTIKILPLFPKYMKGKHGGAPAVHMFQTNRFTLHTDTQTPMQIDGELFVDTRFELEVVHKGLPLLVPAGEDYRRILYRKMD